MGRVPSPKHVTAITGKKRKGHRLSSSSSNRSRTVRLETATSPSTFDVVMGQGPGWSNHPGNEKYQTRIASCYERYDAAKSIPARRSVRKEIVDSIQERGGRFVKFQKEEGIWVEVVDSKAVHDKISMSFRNYRRPSHHRHQPATAEKVSATDSLAAVLVPIKEPKPAAPCMHSANEELARAHFAKQEQPCSKRATTRPTVAVRLEGDQSPPGSLNHGALFFGVAHTLPPPEGQPETIDYTNASPLFLGEAHSLPPPELQPETIDYDNASPMLHHDRVLNQAAGAHSLIGPSQIERVREELRTWVTRELLLRLWLLEAIVGSNIR